MLRVILAFVLALAALVLPAGGSSRMSARGPRAGRNVAPLAPAVPRAPGRFVPLVPEARYPTHLVSSRTDPSRTDAPLTNPVSVARPKPSIVRELLLSFDDGPDLLGTPMVLEELNRRGLKGLFFVNGSHMVGNRPEDLARRDLVRKLAAHGHLVANHTLSHRNVCAEPEGLDHEIDGNAEIITAATGVRPLLFRSPYGARCKRLEEAMRIRGLLQVGWNLDPQEWRGDGEDAVVDYIKHMLGKSRGRYILLLHDTHAQAVRALPRILDWIVHENDRAVRAGEPPIVLRDYTVYFPERPLPAFASEPLLDDLGAAFGIVPRLLASLSEPRKGS